MDPIWEPTLGAVLTEDGQCRFRVWAPDAEAVALHLLTPQDHVLAMEPEREGYYTLELENVSPGSTYYFRLDSEDRPDPASPEARFAAPTSMRDVEASAHLWVLGRKLEGKD